jgi:DNA topoisomerase VI subunit B
MGKKSKKKKEQLMEVLRTVATMIGDFLEKADSDMEERDYEKVAVESIDFLEEELLTIIERQFWSDLDN